MLDAFFVCESCGHLIDRPDVIPNPQPHDCTPCTCGQPGNRTFTFDLTREEQEALFLEWVQGVVGKNIIWVEITGSNSGRSCRMQAGKLRGVEAGEPDVPWGVMKEQNYKVPTIRLEIDHAVICAWANGQQDQDGDHLYYYAEIGREESGCVDLDGPFEWHAFGDWLKTEKRIYWDPLLVPGVTA